MIRRRENKVAAIKQNRGRENRKEGRQGKESVEMDLKQLDSGFSDCSDSAEISHTLKSLKKATVENKSEGMGNLKPNKVTFYSVSDMIKDESIDSLLDEESQDVISTSFIDDDRDNHEDDEDMDSLDYCDFQINQFKNTRTDPCGDQSRKTITNSNRNATSQFPENSSLSPLPCQLTHRPLTSPKAPVSAHQDMNHSFLKDDSGYEDHLLPPLHMDDLDSMDNPLDASQHSSSSCSPQNNPYTILDTRLVRYD